MPTYDYICDACQHEFESFESIKADPQRVCPACGKETLRRKLGPGAAILFKGSGFYQTDYRSESYKKAAKAEKGESGGGKTDGGGGKSDGGKSDGGSSSSAASTPPATPSKPAPSSPST
jgi:putative FmdB family regulatory protein